MRGGGVRSEERGQGGCGPRNEVIVKIKNKSGVRSGGGMLDVNQELESNYLMQSKREKVGGGGMVGRVGGVVAGGGVWGLGGC